MQHLIKYLDLLLKISWSLWSVLRVMWYNKQTQYETPIWRLDLCDFRCTYIVVKGTISVTDPNYDDMTRNYLLKIMYHLSLVFQKLIIHLLIKPKI